MIVEIRRFFSKSFYQRSQDLQTGFWNEEKEEVGRPWQDQDPPPPLEGRTRSWRKGGY